MYVHPSVGEGQSFDWGQICGLLNFWWWSEPRGVWMQVKKQMLGFPFVTSETVVVENSDWSNVQPSKHSSVLSRLVLMELLSANSCHWGSTYLDQWGRNWCQWVERIMQYREEIAKIRNLLQRSSLAPEESIGMNALSSVFGSIWNTITSRSSDEQIEHVTMHGHTWSYMVIHDTACRIYSETRYLFDGQSVIGRQAVISRQAAMVGGASWDKVVQQILTGHEQTRDADQSHMDPLIPSETAHLSSTHCKVVSNDPPGQVHDITVTMYSPGPADRRNPSFFILCGSLESV